MSSFDKWAGDLADRINGKAPAPKRISRNLVDTPLYGMMDEDLWEYNKGNNIMTPWIYPCRVCDKDHEVYDLEDFDPDMHYCGGSPSCCP